MSVTLAGSALQLSTRGTTLNPSIVTCTGSPLASKVLTFRGFRLSVLTTLTNTVARSG
ncbi:hypothetical protein OSI27_00430 [Mycobacterium ulcerans]